MPDHDFDLVVAERLRPPGKNPIWEFFATSWTQVQAPDIVPGEPLSVRWRALTSDVPERGETYSVRIKVDGVLVYTRDNVSAISAHSSPFAIASDDGFQTETLVFSDSAVARAVYRIGRHRLQVDAHSSTGAVLESGSQHFRVRPEPVASSWWEWTTPSFESLEWKHGYALTGRFVNHCEFASLALTSLEFCEVRSEDEPDINPCDYHPVLVSTVTDLPAGASAPVSFNRLHDWKWIIAHPYLVTGPINKTFACAVWFVCTDEFGNVYGGRCTSRRIRHIGVSKKKRFAAVGMQTAAANAAFWAATIFGWPIAAGWYAIAAGLAEAAKDPPEPDPAFRTPVVVHREVTVRPPLHQWTAPTEATYRLLDAVEEIIALEVARTTARSRILGARDAADDAAAGDRRGEFIELSRLLEHATSELQQLTDPFVEEIAVTDELRRKVVAETLASFTAGGLPDGVREQMLTAGASVSALSTLDAAVRNHHLAEFAGANGVFARAFVTSIVQFAEEAQAETDAVLAGEEYVRVEREISDWEESDAASDARRRRTARCC